MDWVRTCACAFDAVAAPLAGAAGLRARQECRLQALVESASRAPYLAQRLGARPAGGWRLQDLPTFGKRELMAHFEGCLTDPSVRLADVRAFVADPRRVGQPLRDGLAAWHSSGSTGVPGLYVSDPQALAVYDALEAARRPCLRPLARALDPLLADERVAFVGAIDGHFAAIVAFERLRALNPWMAPRMHALSLLQPQRALNDALDALRPTVLFTYPSAAILLAEEWRAGRLHARPAEIWTGGETLTPAMRRCIADAFGVPVASEYGASEFLPLACECHRGGLHLNADWALLECVDDAGRPVPAGVRGSRCLLTNLANHLQPLIRYELDDRVRESPTPCPCGSALPVIDVEGRSDDLLRLGDGARGGTNLSPMAVTTVLEEQGGLVAFQLVQLGPWHLELRVRQEGPGALRELHRGREALMQFLQAQGAGAATVTVRAGAERLADASGKVRRVVARPALRRRRAAPHARAGA